MIFMTGGTIMAGRINVRNRYNMIIGFVQDNGNVLMAYYNGKGVVGFYNKSAGYTTDAKNRIVAYCDATVALVLAADGFPY